MRRNPSIRITKNDKQEYARLVRNTKAKINRTLKNYGVDLSNEVTLPKLEDFSTRQQFNEWKNKQSSFTNVANRHYQFVKNEYGVVASKSEIDEIVRDTKKAQKQAEKLIKEIEKKPKVKQEMLQMAKPQDLIGVTKPSDFDFKGVRSKQRLEDIKRNMKKRADEDFYKEKWEQGKYNFIRLIEETFNSDGDDLVKMLQDIPAEDFYEMYLQFESFKFSTYYPKDELELRDLAEELETDIERYYQGKVDLDFKGF